MDALQAHYIDEIHDIRARIAELILKRDDIELVQNPKLEAKYLSTVGKFEIKLAEAEIDARRAKRKLQMCRAAKAASAEIDMDAIDDILAEEYQSWEDATEEDLVYAAGGAVVQQFAVEALDENKLKTLYHKLCKTVHPDTGADGEGASDLLHAILRNYKRADMIAIVAYCDHLGIDTEDKYEGMSEGELSLVSEKIRAQEAVVVEQLSRLNDSFPQNVATNLANQSWIDESVCELQEKINYFKNEKQSYDLKLEELLAVQGEN